MPRYSGPDLCRLSASTIVDMLRRREVSPAELVEASLTRIAEVEPAVNAVVTTCSDRARAAAAAWGGGDPDDPGWLGGLPIGIKDLNAVAGVRTTCGTKGLADFVPPENDPLVDTLERRGGIVVGKTNTPEMGAGANTFNAVFGITRNPYDTAKNAGGSSGGAAVSLATGEVWLSHGSDLAGSLRTPAAYCGVVGLRPSPGRCGGPRDAGFNSEGLSGPMARSVEDTALFLDAMSGYNATWPISFPAPRTAFLAAVRARGAVPRIAWAPTLGGFAPCEPAVLEALTAALRAAEGQGAVVEENCPKLATLDRTYVVLRAMNWAVGPGRLGDEVQKHYKRTLAENIQLGRDLSIDDVYDAQVNRTVIYHAMREFFGGYDVLACPVVGLPPGPVEEEYPKVVDGQPVSSYVDWLKFSFLSTVTGLPALSLPVGRTPDGMPLGLQLIGPPRGEARLLQVAAFIETVVGWDTTPIDPRPAALG